MEFFYYPIFPGRRALINLKGSRITRCLRIFIIVLPFVYDQLGRRLPTSSGNEIFYDRFFGDVFLFLFDEIHMFLEDIQPSR